MTDQEQEILRLNEQNAYLERVNAVLENRVKCYETHSQQQQLTIRGQSMQIIELMAKTQANDRAIDRLNKKVTRQAMVIDDM
jgi:uncharacterized protein (DUF3084 family)